MFEALVSVMAKLKGGIRLFRKRFLMLSLLFCGVISFFWLTDQTFIQIDVKQEEAQEKERLLQMDEPHFWIISDNHFFPDTFIEDSAAFRAFEATALGNDLRYTETILTAFVQKALVEKPTGIIFTGDVTLNGEKAGLDRMVELLEPLQEAGILILAIPGNHDIYNGWAREFKNGDKITTHQISPQDFQRGFSDGYHLSQAIDKHSLSYSLDAGAYRLFLLDSNIYADRFSKKEPVSHGRLSEETLAWLEAGLSDAKEKGKTPILFLHHNLLAHHEQMTDGFVLNNAPDVLSLVNQYEVPLALSGHTHLQNILQQVDPSNFYEISSGSFSAAGTSIGRLTLQKNTIIYENESFDPLPYLDSQHLANPDLKNYSAYVTLKAQELGEEMARELFRSYAIDADTQLMKEVGEAYVFYFMGGSQLTPLEKEARLARLQESLPRKADSSLLESYRQLLDAANWEAHHHLVIQP